jgi:carboxyl-terminal processing protease
MGPAAYGSAKITTARFYRIDGRSTQLEGVASDIRLPSLLDSLDVGEDKLTYALPFSRIAPADYALCWNIDRYIPSLKAASDARLAGNEKYQKHLANVRGMKEIGDREEVSLEFAARKRQMAADREYREIDEMEKEESEEEEDKPKRRRRNERKENDVVLDEAFRILSDLIRMNGGEEIPKPRGWWL